MGADSKIEWCHATFNPWVGCTKVSAACDHCYAESWAKRAGTPELWTGQRRRTTVANWRQPIKWNKQAKAAGERRRVFCASLADVFDNQVPEQWRADLWALIADCQHLDWLLLTKRPQNIRKMLPSTTCEAMIAGCAWPWSNVWLGTTVENQEEAARRIPSLLAVPAAVHFLSCEPLLGFLDLSAFDGIGWIICGGESGGNARHMDPDWARDLHGYATGKQAAFFMKQMTGRAPIPSDLMIREFPVVM